ncbi:sugar phosphate nucleotidyltransferase [Halobacillus seohaensis]|uniref:Sugar phosphate nucleotidyltransferase n=1 Tax=Halobacillus seohaensis TaxID=447421 RepID=A0ABW2EMP4_9BACI
MNKVHHKGNRGIIFKKLRERGKQGIILDGGSGIRLSPSTYSVNKLSVFDKSMIYLSSICIDGIKEILIISTKKLIESANALSEPFIKLIILKVSKGLSPLPYIFFKLNYWLM